MTTFPSIRIEGGLLGPDVLDELLIGNLPGQRAADFGLAGTGTGIAVGLGTEVTLVRNLD